MHTPTAPAPSLSTWSAPATAITPTHCRLSSPTSIPHWRKWVFGINRNDRSASSGIGVRPRPKSVYGSLRNNCSFSPEIDRLSREPRNCPPRYTQYASSWIALTIGSLTSRSFSQRWNNRAPKVDPRSNCCQRPRGVSAGSAWRARTRLRGRHRPPRARGRERALNCWRRISAPFPAVLLPSSRGR